MKLVLIMSHNQAVKYCDGHDTGNCRSICRGKCKTLRTLPFRHGIELSFFFKTTKLHASPKGTRIGKSGSLGNFLKITYHRPQSSVCFGEIMQFYQRCVGPPVLRNNLIMIGMAHLMLG
jgi:hypothetical protein